MREQLSFSSKHNHTIRSGVAALAIITVGGIGYGLHNIDNKQTPKPVKTATTTPLTPAQKDWKIANDVALNIGDTQSTPWSNCNEPNKPVYHYNVNLVAKERPLAKIHSPVIKSSSEKVAQYLIAQQIMWSLDNFEGDGHAQTGAVIDPNNGNPVIINTVTVNHDQYAINTVNNALTIPSIKAETNQLINYLTAEAVVNQDLTYVNKSAVIASEERFITDPTLKSLVNQALSDESQVLSSYLSNPSYGKVSHAAEQIYSQIANDTQALETSLNDKTYLATKVLRNEGTNSLGNDWVWGGPNSC